MMTETDKVSNMGESQETKQAEAKKSKSILSPELNEFLHMLKSLEGEIEPKLKSR
jgi:hypothetical protein